MTCRSEMSAVQADFTFGNRIVSMTKELMCLQQVAQRLRIDAARRAPDRLRLMPDAAAASSRVELSRRPRVTADRIQR